MTDDTIMGNYASDRFQLGSGGQAVSGGGGRDAH